MGICVSNEKEYSVDPAMAQYKLVYFNAQARGEPIRLILKQAGVPFEERRVDFSEWGPMKKTTPLGTLPILEFEGKRLVQSIAIMRFLARRHGLAGKTAWDEARADMVVDTVLELCTDIYKLGVPGLSPRTEEEQRELVEKFENELLPAHYDNFDKLLKENNGGNGFFVGDSVTWADLFFYHWTYMPFHHKIREDLLNMSKWPKLASLSQRISNLPRVKEHINTRPQTRF